METLAPHREGAGTGVLCGGLLAGFDNHLPEELAQLLNFRLNGWEEFAEFFGFLAQIANGAHGGRSSFIGPAPARSGTGTLRPLSIGVKG